MLQTALSLVYDNIFYFLGLIVGSVGIEHSIKGVVKVVLNYIIKH